MNKQGGRTFSKVKRNLAFQKSPQKSMALQPKHAYAQGIFSIGD